MNRRSFVQWIAAVVSIVFGCVAPAIAGSAKAKPPIRWSVDTAKCVRRARLIKNGRLVEFDFDVAELLVNVDEQIDGRWVALSPMTITEFEQRYGNQ